MPFDHFSVAARFFDRAGKYTLSPTFLELLAASSSGTLLDAGGGTGRVAEVVQSLVKNVIVSDPSMAMLRYAGSRNIVSVCAPAEFLPFPSNTFDRILMVDAFHHVKQQKRCANELWRVLTPGGRIVIVEPDIHRFAVVLVAIMEKFLFMTSHILSGDRIAAFFQNPSTTIQTAREGNSVYICIIKSQSN